MCKQGSEVLLYAGASSLRRVTLVDEEGEEEDLVLRDVRPSNVRKTILMAGCTQVIPLHNKSIQLVLHVDDLVVEEGGIYVLLIQFEICYSASSSSLKYLFNLQCSKQYMLRWLSPII